MAEDRIVVETPPARLFTLMTALVSTSGSDGNPAGEVLAKALRISPVEIRVNWARAHAELFTLVRSAEAFVRSRTRDFDGSPHAALFDGLARAVGNLPLTDSWGQHRQAWTQMVSVALPFAVHVAERDIVPTSVATADIEDVLTRIRSLIELVRESELPTEFQASLLRALRDLADRIERFDLSGPEGVEHATAIVIGTLTINEAPAKAHPGIVKESADVIGKIADALLKGYAAVQLAGPLFAHLLGKG